MTVNPQIFPISTLGSGDTTGNLSIINGYGQLLTYDGSYPSGTEINTYSTQLTGNGTTSVTSETSYISSIAICVSVAGAASTITIEDRGMPFILVNAMSTSTVSTSPTVLNFNSPLKMLNGIQIVTTGSTAATVNVFITYYQ